MNGLDIRFIYLFYLDIADIGHRRRVGKRRLGIDQAHSQIFQKERHGTRYDHQLIGYIVGKDLFQMLLVDLCTKKISRVKDTILVNFLSDP